jgi:hypothetical protein
MPRVSLQISWFLSILLCCSVSSASQYRPMADELYFRPAAFYAPFTSTVPAYIDCYNTNQSFIGASLPPNAALLTLRVVNGA